jgi:hypothetical protein
MYSVLNCHNVANHIEFYLGRLWFNVASTGNAADGFRRDNMRWRGLDSSGSGQGQLKSSFESCNEPTGSIKCWETIEWHHNWWPLE